MFLKKKRKIVAEEIAKGSTETFDKTCEVTVCEGNKGAASQQTEAEKYCKQCRLYLCSSCCIDHEKSRLTKHHELQNISTATGISKKENQPFEKQSFEGQLLPCDFVTFPIEERKKKPEIKCMWYDNFSDRLIVLVNYTYSDIYKQRNYLYDKSYLHFQTQNESLKLPLSVDPLAISFSPIKSDSNGLIVCSNKSVKKINYKLSSSYRGNTIEGTTDDIMDAPLNCSFLAVEDFNNQIAVLLSVDTQFTNLPKWQIQCITYDGKLLGQICYNKNRKPIFTKPRCLATNTENTILYVSERSNHSVIALDVEGNVLFKFKHKDMKKPDGMCVDTEGNIYIACENALVQINKNGKDARVLLHKPKSRLTRVAFNPVNRTLAVCEKTSETVSVLRFAD